MELIRAALQEQKVATQYLVRLPLQVVDLVRRTRVPQEAADRVAAQETGRDQRLEMATHQVPLLHKATMVAHKVVPWEAAVGQEVPVLQEAQV